MRFMNEESGTNTKKYSKRVKKAPKFLPLVYALKMLRSLFIFFFFFFIRLHISAEKYSTMKDEHTPGKNKKKNLKRLSVEQKKNNLYIMHLMVNRANDEKETNEKISEKKKQNIR